MSKPKPPKLSLRLLRWFCDPQLLKYIEGDLEELFRERIEKKGLKGARWHFTWEVVRLFRPGIVKSKWYGNHSNQISMLVHYLKIAKRNFLKDKSYSWVNLLGLVAGMTISLLIFQYVVHERSYDAFHSELNNKFRLVQSSYRNNLFTGKTTLTPHGLGKEIKERVPGVKEVVRIRKLSADEGVVMSSGKGSKKFMEYDVWFVDPGFLRMFDFSLNSQHAEGLLSHPNGIVLTREAAGKYFGDKDPVGEVLKMSAGSFSGDFYVTGVLEDLPPNTHIKFDFLVPLEHLISHYGIYVRSSGWDWFNFHTYLWLENDADRSHMVHQIDQLMSEHWSEEWSQSNESIAAGFQPIQDIHLKTDFANGLDYGNNSEQNVRFFAFLALVILVIAWTNYINLSYARAMRRIKELGIRKVLGAFKSQVIVQLLIESLVLNVIAAIISVFMAGLLMPYMSGLIGKQLLFSLFYSGDFWQMFVLVIISGAVLAGLYPAVLAAGFSPLNTLKTRQDPRSYGGRLFRKSLVVFQLAVSLLLIAGTYLIYQQVLFMKNKDLGISMDQVLVIHGPRVVLEEGRDLVPVFYERFRNKLLQHPDIHAISGSSNVPGAGEIWVGGMRKLGDPHDRDKEGRAVLVDQHFTDVFQFEFLAGGPFVQGMTDYEAVIINESAVRAFGLHSPGESIGQSIVMSNMDTLRIQGVIKNAHWNSPKEAIAPTIWGINNLFNAYLSIRINTINLKETLEYIEKTFREVYPKDPYRSFFPDESFDQHFKEEQQFGKLFGLFSFIAILISCYGLFSMVAYTISLRMKEIGIRKVLGASLGNLSFLLSKEYLYMTLFAAVLAIPVFLWTARIWLDHYAYRISLSWDLFTFPTIGLVMIVLLSIGNRILATANVDPVEQLKDE